MHNFWAVKDPVMAQMQEGFFIANLSRIGGALLIAHLAEAHAAQLVVQVQSGGGVPPVRLRAGDYLDQWLKDYAAGAVALSTQRRYEDIIRLHLKPALGHIPLSRLTAQAIQSYTSVKLAGGQSPASVLYHYRVLHEALQHAVRWGLLGRNPADFVDPPRMRYTEMRTWDEEQVRLFLAEAKRSSPHYTLYLTAVLTGMRQGELLGLRWKDVDLTLGTASIRQTFYRLGKQQMFNEPKSHRSRRMVELDPKLVDELRRLRDEQKERRNILGADYEDRDLIFCQLDGKPLHGQNLVRREFHAIASRARLPRIRFHDCGILTRRTCCSMASTSRWSRSDSGTATPPSRSPCTATSSPGCRRRQPGWSPEGCWGLELEVRISRD